MSMNARRLQVAAAGQTPPAGPLGWQASIDLAVAQQNWSPIINWYTYNTGHEALGYAVEDLTDAGGMITTSYDGQIIEGIHGTSLRIAHSNVTIRGCRFDGGSTYGAYYNPTMGSTYTNNVVEYCTFAAVGNQETNAMLFQSAEGSPTRNLTLRYNNCGFFLAGIRTQGNVLVEYNWIHDFYHPVGGHANSYRHVGNTNCVARRNYGTDGSSGTMSIYFDKEPTANIEYSENIMSGQSTPAGEGGPSYLVNMKSGDYQAAATGIKILNNMWGPDYQYGIMAGGQDITWGSNGNEKSGNYDLMSGVLMGN